MRNIILTIKLLALLAILAIQPFVIRSEIRNHRMRQLLEKEISAGELEKDYYDAEHVCLLNGDFAGAQSNVNLVNIQWKIANDLYRQVTNQ